MKTSVSNLRAHLGKYIRSAKAGREVVITDRDEPIAKLVAVRATSAQQLVVHAPAPGTSPLSAVKRKGHRVRDFDGVAALLSDRDKR